MTNLHLIDSIEAKLFGLRDSLSVVSTEEVDASKALGRVLAEPIRAFRDSPALNVSAMDGFALRHKDLSLESLPVQATASAGGQPLKLQANCAIRILTGAVVPEGADVVIRKEDTTESNQIVRFLVSSNDVKLGQNIRFQGENARAGDVIIPAGTPIEPQSLAGILTFSDQNRLRVHRPLNVSIINTGDELVPWGEAIQPWQIRDSNGPFLESILKPRKWCQTNRFKVCDSFEAIFERVRDSLQVSDVLLLTGGVSMGETDYVPKAIEQAGGLIAFHRIPIRPGKPMLGASTQNGKLILGLPGNPVSVAVTFRRYGLTLMEFMAGMKKQEDAIRVTVRCQDQKTLDLVWFRLVQRCQDGSMEIIPSLGSGDIASLTKSSGFVEVRPAELSAGTKPFYSWS